MKQPSVEEQIEEVIAKFTEDWPKDEDVQKIISIVASTQQAQMMESLIERLQEELVGCSDHKTLEDVLAILKEECE